MTNQNWNDPANPQGQQPTYGQPYGQPPAPDAGYTAGQAPGYQAAGGDQTYGQGSYGATTPSYGTDPAQTSSYGSAGAAPTYGQTDPAASTYGQQASYGDPAQTGSYGSPSAASGYGQAASYGDPAQTASYGDPAQTGSYGAASYGQPEAQSYAQPEQTYGSPVQGGYSQQAYDPYQQQQTVSPYGYDSGYATPAPALADFGKRALGYLVDFVAPVIVFYVVIAIAGALGAAGDAGAMIGLLLMAVAYLGLIGFWIWNRFIKGGTGQTLGRQVAKTKLVSEATGQPIGALNAFLRDLCHIVDGMICSIGWLFPLWDAKRQTLADKIMKTVVVNDDGIPSQGQQF